LELPLAVWGLRAAPRDMKCRPDDPNRGEGAICKDYGIPARIVPAEQK
jgi:hypothetical protein